MLAPHGIEIAAVQLPGREERVFEEPIKLLPDLLGQILENWEDLSGEVPYALFGHSFGATIAFELAKDLSITGAPLPTRLFLSGRNPPHITVKRMLIEVDDDIGYLQSLIDAGEITIPKEILDDRVYVRNIAKCIKADCRMSRGYTSNNAALLNIPFSIFGGNADLWTSSAALAEWKRYTTGKCRLRMFNGDHFFHQHSAPQLLRALREDLCA
jgi:medium-chain acyl-[acyl-carrier-protein] hydrolase